jgi:sulfide:quinone oxidoreductase
MRRRGRARTVQPMDGLRVLIAGGGVGGIETLLALQALAGDRVAIELLAPERHFTHRPLSVTEPFRPERPEKFPLAAIAADRGVTLHRDAVGSIDPDQRIVETQDRARLSYDALVLALGARPVEALHGVLTFRGSRDAHRVRAILESLHSGWAQRVAFIVPPGTTWSLPLYELALQTAGAAPGAELHVVTCEPEPLAAFGAAAGAEVASLLERHGIALHTGVDAESYADRLLWNSSGWSLAADQAIALPRLEGPRVRGIPADADGFVPVDEYTRARGVDSVHAVGDIADHAIKQGGLAAQQADVAAQVIAAAAGADVRPERYRPVLRGMLIGAGEVRYLRHEPGGTSEVSEDALWWPPHKVAGRHLAGYLAGHMEFARFDERTAGIGGR